MEIPKLILHSLNPNSQIQIIFSLSSLLLQLKQSNWKEKKIFTNSLDAFFLYHIISQAFVTLHQTSSLYSVYIRPSHFSWDHLCIHVHSLSYLHFFPCIMFRLWSYTCTQNTSLNWWRWKKFFSPCCWCFWQVLVHRNPLEPFFCC